MEERKQKIIKEKKEKRKEREHFVKYRNQMTSFPDTSQIPTFGTTFKGKDAMSSPSLNSTSANANTNANAYDALKPGNPYRQFLFNTTADDIHDFTVKSKDEEEEEEDDEELSSVKGFLLDSDSE